MAAPKLTSSSSLTGVDIGVPISLQFDQSITAGSGTIRFLDAADKVAAELSVTDPRVMISGNQVTLAPGRLLSPGWRYKVTLAGSPFVNTLGEAVVPGSTGLLNLTTTVPPFRDYGSSVADPLVVGNIDNQTRSYSNFVGFDNGTDDFQFDLSGISHLDIKLTGLTGNAATVLFYSGGATYPGWNTTASGNRTISVDNLAPGRYTLDVRNYADFTPYNLSITATTTGVVSSDIGTFNTAKPLSWHFSTGSGSQFLTGQIGATIQKAYYAFTVDSQTRLAFNTHSTSAAPHLKIVQDKNGNNSLDAGEALAESLSGSDGNAYAETGLLNPGTYYLYAESGSGLLDTFNAEVFSFSLDNIRKDKILTPTTNGEKTAASDIAIVNRSNPTNTYIYNIQDIGKNISIGLVSNGANLEVYDDQGGLLASSEQPGAYSDSVRLYDLDQNTEVSKTKSIRINVYSESHYYEYLSTDANTNYKLSVTEDVAAANAQKKEAPNDIDGSAYQGEEKVRLSNGGGAYNVANITVLDGGTGQDAVTLAGSGSTLTVSGVETLTGSSGQDVVTLGGSGNTVSVAGIESMIGSAGFDTVVLSGNRTDYSLTRSAGGNAKIVDSSGATMVLSGIERLAFSDRDETTVTETWQNLKSGFTAPNGAAISQESISPVTDATRGTVNSRVMINGAEIQGVPSTLKKGWKVGTLADTDGDGKTEIFFFGVEMVAGVGEGWGATWELGTGNTVETTQTHFNMVKQGWEVVAASNLNGIKGDEVIWQNTLTGDKAIWTDYNGDGKIDGGYLIEEPGKDVQDRIVGVSDLDKDGLSELLLFNDANKKVSAFELSPVTNGDVTAALVKTYDNFTALQSAATAAGVTLTIFPVIG